MRWRAIAMAGQLAAVLTLSAQSPPLVSVGTMAMAVRGRIDHLAFDAARHRLFVAALGNDSVEVFDTALEPAKGHLRSLGGFHEPQGLAVLPDANAVAVANGASGTLQLLDATTFAVRWTAAVGGDADNVRYDAAAKRIYVAAEGGLVAVDPASGAIRQRIAISGHPESFQLEPAGPRVFANLPGSRQIVVADRQQGSVTGRWPTGSRSGNYPMAIDIPTGRVFIGFRQPAALALLDAGSGRVVTVIESIGDTDDLFYDAPRKRVYVIGGEGGVDVLARDGDALRRLARVATRAGARTGLWVASQNRLYVARPARGSQSADVEIFEARD